MRNSAGTRSSLLNDPDFVECAPCATLRAKPLGFVDVGARGGVHELVRPIAGLTAVLGFEPEPGEYERLRDEFATGSPWAFAAIEPVALGPDEGPSQLHLLSAPTNSSLRRPNQALTHRYEMVKWQVVGTLALETLSLDRVLFSRRAGEDFWGEVIKLDTQGTEHEILRGAERTLHERTMAIVCEVSFCELYTGQKLFSEVELYLRERGFSFYGFLAMHHRSTKALDKRSQVSRERALYADAVFLRDPLPGGPPAAPLRGRQVHVLFVASLLLGYADFALELARSTWADGAEWGRIERLVLRQTLRPPSEAAREAHELAVRVQADPELANVEVGRFVDLRRGLCDYDDVAAPASSVGG